MPDAVAMMMVSREKTSLEQSGHEVVDEEDRWRAGSNGEVHTSNVAR